MSVVKPSGDKCSLNLVHWPRGLLCMDIIFKTLPLRDTPETKSAISDSVRAKRKERPLPGPLCMIQAAQFGNTLMSSAVSSAIPPRSFCPAAPIIHCYMLSWRGCRIELDAVALHLKSELKLGVCTSIIVFVALLLLSVGSLNWWTDQRTECYLCIVSFWFLILSAIHFRLTL